MGERFARIDGATTGSPKHSSSTTMETTSSSSIHTAMPTLKGKRVFITGGTTGIGRFSDQKAQKFSPTVGIKRN
jgi:NADPH:quinone reductase-like Zn-dependent oxidoreductase